MKVLLSTVVSVAVIAGGAHQLLKPTNAPIPHAYGHMQSGGSGQGLGAGRFERGAKNSLSAGLGKAKAAVPIPGTLLLFGAGFGSLAVWQWRQNRKNLGP